MLAAALAALEKALDVRLRDGGRFNLLNTDLPKILASVAGGSAKPQGNAVHMQSTKKHTSVSFQVAQPHADAEVDVIMIEVGKMIGTDSLWKMYHTQLSRPFPTLKHSRPRDVFEADSITLSLEPEGSVGGD